MWADSKCSYRNLTLQLAGNRNRLAGSEHRADAIYYFRRTYRHSLDPDFLFKHRHLFLDRLRVETLGVRVNHGRGFFTSSIGAIITFLLTVSFLHFSYGLPVSSDAGQFLIKDLVLLGVSIWTAAEARLVLVCSRYA